MASHISILPTEFLDSLSAQLDGAQSHQFLRLPHPRTGIPSLFLPYPQHSGTSSARWSILEVQAVSPPNERSWFMGEGQWSGAADGRLLMMTPIDPSFLLIPLLRADGFVGTFRPLEDVFEEALPKLVEQSEKNASPKDPTASISLRDLETFASLDCAKAAMKNACEVKEITPEIVVYRYSQAHLVEYLRKKVARLSRPEVFESSRTLIRGLAKDGLMDDGKEHLLPSARQRAACDILSQYLPQDVHAALIASYDFAALDSHLKAIQDDIAATAASALANSANAKSSGNGEAGDKKRKNQKGSHGVEKLKKANTKGMAKISSFFQKPKAK
ncbi:hypothetical protein GLOTRDRAFT_115274 [Gloeophyllum trabeum ATCC 11539]|uniref:Ribonuclease H2 subunit B n=1 Tax=Gloeophyllum trabeum (strain ATCC 11539 / FP-39264 / Madison 617) TaxID=670483 RepID=S7RVJ9_GLOTA|nr:uncharacterized protein GLOTRDRAFT_115274 [Gloeophyllum trabeum ATCC 11539]EPQ57284.1 hypothetical protein GLOTRDRAFT_115274 [Gloeophyllum trabeum ATCC 11539]